MWKLCRFRYTNYRTVKPIEDKSASDRAATDSDSLLSRIGKQVVPLLTGSGAGQILLFLAYPVISRLYSTADFGVLAIFTAISMPLTAVASFRYELALPGAKTREEAEQLAAACALITLLVASGSLFLLSLSFLSERVREAFSGNILFIAFIPLAVLAGGTMRWLNYWYVRHRKFKVIALGSVTQSSAMAATQIAGGALILGPFGLLASQFFAPLAAFLFMTLKAGPRPSAVWRVPATNVMAVVRRYRTFSVYGAPHAFVNATGQHLPSFLFASLLGLGPAGIFLMAQRILRHPADLTGEAIRQAAFPELVKAAENRKLASAVMRISAVLALVTLPALVIIVIYGPELFAVVLGEQWRESGTIASYLIFYVASSFLNVPVNVAIQILEIQRLQLRLEILVFILRVVSIVAGAIIGGLILASALFSISGVIVSTAMLILTLRHARSYDGRKVGDYTRTQLKRGETQL